MYRKQQLFKFKDRVKKKAASVKVLIYYEKHRYRNFIDTIWISAPYRIYKSGVKSKAQKYGFMEI
jgi:hypothetical protein